MKSGALQTTRRLLEPTTRSVTSFSQGRYYDRHTVVTTSLLRRAADSIRQALLAPHTIVTTSLLEPHSETRHVRGLADRYYVVTGTRPETDRYAVQSETCKDELQAAEITHKSFAWGEILKFLGWCEG